MKLLRVLLPVLAGVVLAGCQTLGYSFTGYEEIDKSTYRFDRMAFKQTGSLVNNENCFVEVYSKFFEADNKLGACGRLVDRCGNNFSRELTQKWFDNADLVLSGEYVSRAAFFSLNRTGKGKDKASCVTTELAWDAKFKNMKPYFKGRNVTIYH